MSTKKFKITFTEEVLALTPSNPEIHAQYIASKAPDAQTMEEEIAEVGVEGALERTMTVFPRTGDDIPYFYDYQIKGFFKDACGMLSRASGKDEKGKRKAVNESSKLTAYKKIIDGLIFVSPRRIPIEFKGYTDTCQRPLRAQTPQGERIALATSETCPEGATIEFEVECLNDELQKAVEEWMKYGRLRGLGCWRNSGKGRFKFEVVE